MNNPLYIIKNTTKYHNCNNKNLTHIGYGIDDNYVRCAATSIASICINNKNRSFHFYIITSGISNKNKSYFKMLSSQYFINITIIEIDSLCFSKLPTKIYLSTAMYFRLILPIILKDVSTLFYFDADIICLKNADKLFGLNLNNHVIAAVPDLKWLQKKRIAALNLDNPVYFNSGVLAINIQKWLQLNILDKIISLVNSNPSLFQYPDQDALNVILNKNTFYLDRCFNCIEPTKEEESSVVFLHFAANPKPWSMAWPICGKTTDFNINLYQFYEKQTPWPSTPPQKPANYKEMEFYSKCLKRHGRYKESFYWYLKYIIAKTNYLLK